jgi:hypothetical protein
LVTLLRRLVPKGPHRKCPVVVIAVRFVLVFHVQIAVPTLNERILRKYFVSWK